MSDVVTISMEDYLNDFVPSLENFCSKSPLQPICKVVKETGNIELFSKYLNETFTFKIDPLKDKKIQIKDIKTNIEKNYPILFDHKKIPLSKDEQEKLINEGQNIREVLDMRVDKYLPRYKVLRIHNKYNELDCFDFKTKKMIKFKVQIPTVDFLNKLFSSNKEDMSNSFRSLVKFMYCIRK